MVQTMKTNKKPLDTRAMDIATVIKEATGREAPFYTLTNLEKTLVASYVVREQLPIKLIGYKWYDIIGDKFHVEEFSLDGGGFARPIVQAFDSFEAFYNYVDGDIYSGSCFYGYAFSEEEIAKYSLEVKHLNFDSFIDYTIDSFSFEQITAKEEDDRKIKAKRAKEMVEVIRDFRPIKNADDLKEKLKLFCKKFAFFGSGDLFVSFLMKDASAAEKRAVVECASRAVDLFSLSFDLVLVLLGKEAATYVIENYRNSGVRPVTEKSHKKRFTIKLQDYESGATQHIRESGFDDAIYFYFVRDKYACTQGETIRVTRYFDNFGAFSAFLAGDLRGANLRSAPSEEVDAQGLITDAMTILPASKTYQGKEIIKKYDGRKFLVQQKWSDKFGNVIKDDEHSFDHFCDFVHFLKGDLSGADFVNCDGIGRIASIRGLNVVGIKARSKELNAFGAGFQQTISDNFDTDSFEQTKNNELATTDAFALVRGDEYEFGGKVSYISDIHLIHRFIAHDCKTIDDIDYVKRTIVDTIASQANSVNLIAGDTSSSFKDFEDFVSLLSEQHVNGSFFFTLGNHELWCREGEKLDDITAVYAEILEKYGWGRMHLVQNNLFYCENVWKEISEKELEAISVEELREKTKKSYLTIFGGIGFAGMNESFNANNGIYRSTLNREDEKRESKKFVSLYRKVVQALRGRSVIVVTHMPIEDWAGPNAHYDDNVVYVSGHNHRNYYLDDGKCRVYADNQIGYRGKNLSLKHISMHFTYDLFDDYKDGIYEITKEDYDNFYRGIRDFATLNRPFKNVYMLKRNRVYMFFMRSLKDQLMILDGGRIKKAGDHDLEYFYEHMVGYSKSISLLLEKYNQFQSSISKEIKRIGGTGRIHGCIVDINGFNHLFINPLDGTVTPYFATSMVDKYVYPSVPHLLRHECPGMYQQYVKLIETEEKKNPLVPSDSQRQLPDKRYYTDDTRMYKYSRVIGGLQYLTKHNVIKRWDDTLASSDVSEAKGKLIIQGLLGPDGDFDN